MKTKLPVRRNFHPDETEMAIRRAIHILQDATDDEVVLMHDLDSNVWLVPSILDDEEPIETLVNNIPVTIPRPAGTVQYQVSDGPPEERSTSYDFYRFEDAKKCFEGVVQLGWKKYNEQLHV